MKSITVRLRNVIYKFLSGIEDSRPLLVVLCYHSVGDDDWYYTVAENEFKKQIEYMMIHYQPATLQDIYNHISGKKIIDQPSFVITFDDGYRNILSVRDFLKEKQIKPSLFLISNINKASKTQLQNNLQYLNSLDIQSLIKSGWDIGSHSLSHEDFWRLSSDHITTEVVTSKKQLEQEHKQKVSWFSYPRGRYTRPIVESVQKANYDLAVTMDDGFICRESNQYLIPRIGVDSSHSFEVFTETITSSVIMFRMLIKNFAGGLVKHFI